MDSHSRVGRDSRRAAGILLMLILASAGGLPSQTTRPSHLPTLTTAEQVRELTTDQAKRGYPVHLRAVVTYVDFAVGDFFVQDATAGIYVNENNKSLHFRPGDLLEIDGVSEELDFAPQIAKARYQRLGQTSLPQPRKVRLGDMLSTRYDSQWVQLEGIVQHVEPDRDRLRLDVVSDGRSLLVSVMDPAGLDRDFLVDARVKATGVYAALYNPNNQLVGVWLAVPTARQISIEEPPPADPFSVPVRPISSLMAFTARGASEHRVHVQGTVTLQRSKGVYIQDGRIGLYIPSLPAARLRPGDRVDVIGFAEMGDYTPVLQYALYRRIGSASLPPPLMVTAAEARSGAFDTLRVRLDATLRDVRHSETDRTLVLQDGDTLFEARIAEANSHRDWTQLLGSRLRLTGVCSVNVDRNRVPDTFNILLDSPDSVVVLARPSWWTLRNTLVVLGLVAGLALAVAVWVVVLRRRVRAQTEVIQRRLESEAVLEKRFQYVARATNDAIWDWDLATQAVAWTGGIQATFRHATRQSGTGYGWWMEHLHPEDRERVEGSRQAAIESGGETWSAEYRFLRGDGKYASVVDRGYVMRDNVGKAVRMIGAMMDITARTRIEKQMQEAKEAAEIANRAKSEFLANMSHEIRTPMNGVLGMTDLLLDTELDSEQREYAGMVKTSAESLLTIINDILDFSKIEAGKLELETIDFKLRGSVEPTLKTFAVRAQQKGLELNCMIEPDVLEALLGDPSRLRQVLVNLLGNAIKFTESGEVNLKVQRESVSEESVELHFSLEDTGIGIPAEKLASIFEPFTQADGSTVRRFGGTGLGLTICSRLVEMMNGHIWVESTPGQGSIFHFTARFGLPECAASPEPLGIAQLEGMQVLVVDDNRTNRSILERLLASWGIQSTLAGNGRQALEVLAQMIEAHTPLPLVLTDDNMPELDGFQLAEEIRRIPRFAGAAMIMLSSGGQRGDAARCRELGLAGYLTKPVGQAELLDALLRVAGSKVSADRPVLVTRHSLREERRILHILLAEDNVVNQKLASQLLEKQGHTVVTAGNGREALDRLEKERFDLVLMDVQMPEMDGFEATAAIRKTEQATGVHLPVVAMTAHAMRGDMERCLAAGMDGYVSKPINAKEFLMAVRTALEKSGMSPEERVTQHPRR